MVGFWEYGNALEHFDKLLPLLSDEERDAVDQLIQERDEFTIYRHLSRKYRSTENRRSSKTAERSGDYDVGRGLAWVIALARLEVGAMLASHTGTKEPFAAVRPTRFEMPQFAELLLDGARVHYLALSRDPRLRRVAKLSPRYTAFLSYSRRLVLARAIMRAGMKASMERLDPRQIRELARWKKELDELQAGFVLKLLAYLEGTQSQKTNTETSEDTDTLLEYCYALLRAEQRELRSGRARTIDLR